MKVLEARSREAKGTAIFSLKQRGLRVDMMGIFKFWKSCHHATIGANVHFHAPKARPVGFIASLPTPPQRIQMKHDQQTHLPPCCSAWLSTWLHAGNGTSVYPEQAWMTSQLVSIIPLAHSRQRDVIQPVLHFLLFPQGPLFPGLAKGRTASEGL